MPYPKLAPINKHDLVGQALHSQDDNLQIFHSIDDIISALNDDGSNTQNACPKLIASVYTYENNAPEKPPSNMLLIVGYCSQSLVSSILPPSSNNEASSPSAGIMPFYIGVKRADGKNREKLKQARNIPAIQNSDRFAQLCKSLRNYDGSSNSNGGGAGGSMVAILKADKYGRVIFVTAMDGQESGSDFAANCFIGKLSSVQQALSEQNQNTAMEEENNLNTTNGTPTSDLPWGTDDSAAAATGTTQEPAATSDLPWETDNNDSGTPMESAPSSDLPWETDNNDSSTPKESAPASDLPWETNNTSESVTASDLPWETNITQEAGSGDLPWEQEPSSTTNDTSLLSGNKRQRSDSQDQHDAGGNEEQNNDGTFHADSGAAAADKFYSELTRSLGTRADSKLFHMRNFNGWVKATQIAELDPKTQNNKEDSNENSSKKKRRKKQPQYTKGKLRILDLACGKGGDLGKWVLHTRKIQNYVGIDVARGSLADAAIRARKMRTQLNGKCVFTCADLGADVPGRPKHPGDIKMQKLSCWSLEKEDQNEFQEPKFALVRGGGISLTDKFDVVSIQFAIHYMMSSLKRARRFFHTVSQLLDIGGNLVATTIDARVVLDHMMDMGKDFHFDDNKEDKEDVVVSVGKGSCQLKFKHDTVRKIMSYSKKKNQNKLDEDLFGLEYTFTLVEGDDHAAGVGQAVDLPEWLTPLTVLEALAEEAGMSLEYAHNFHEFYDRRRDPRTFHSAHTALYNMNVLNQKGSISQQEWDISRMYMAVKFRKDRESTMVLDKEQVENDDGDESEEEASQKKIEEKIESQPEPVKKVNMFMEAMSRARAAYTSEEWSSLSGAERTARTNEEMKRMKESM